MSHAIPPQTDFYVQLKQELEIEKRKNNELEKKVKLLENARVKLQLELDKEEEAITNKLMNRLSLLKQEKDKLLERVRQSEYALRMILEDKKKLEEELDSHTHSKHQLKQQINHVQSEKQKLEETLSTDRVNLINAISHTCKLLEEEMQHEEHETTLHESQPLHSHHQHHILLLDTLKLQIKSLEEVQQEYHNHTKNYREENEQLREQVRKLENETFLLNQKLKREIEKRKEHEWEQYYGELENEFLSERNVLQQVKRQNSFQGNSQQPTTANAATNTTTRIPPMIINNGGYSPMSSPSPSPRARRNSQLTPHSGNAADPTPLQQLVMSNYSQMSPRITSSNVSVYSISPSSSIEERMNNLIGSASPKSSTSTVSSRRSSITKYQMQQQQQEGNSSNSSSSTNLSKSLPHQSYLDDQMKLRK